MNILTMMTLGAIYSIRGDDDDDDDLGDDDDRSGSNAILWVFTQSNATLSKQPHETVATSGMQH